MAVVVMIILENILELWEAIVEDMEADMEIVTAILENIDHMADLRHLPVSGFFLSN